MNEFKILLRFAIVSCCTSSRTSTSTSPRTMNSNSRVVHVIVVTITTDYGSAAVAVDTDLVFVRFTTTTSPDDRLDSEPEGVRCLIPGLFLRYDLPRHTRR
jgi:hypothetical protein